MAPGISWVTATDVTHSRQLICHKNKPTNNLHERFFCASSYKPSIEVAITKLLIFERKCIHEKEKTNT